MANQNPGISIPPVGTCDTQVRQSIQDIVRHLGTSSDPTFDSMTLEDLTITSPSNIYDLDHDSFAGFAADEHVAHSGISVLAGTGLSGGGTIDGNVTLNCDITQYTDEAAQDAIGTMIVNTATIDLTYTDATPELKADLNATLKSNYDAAFTHVSNNGSDHSYIDQDVTDDATPQFEGTWYKLDTATSYECYARNYGWYAYAYDNSVASRASSLNFRRSRGGSAGSEAAVQDDDWLLKMRCYGHNGTSYVQYGGCIYKVDDASAVEGLFSYYYQDGDAYYVAEFGKPHVRFGNLGTTATPADNYVQIDPATGDVSFSGDAGFYPRRLNQSAIPASGTGDTQIDVGEEVVWRDSDDGKVYKVYNDTDSGIVSVEMT